MSPSTCSVQKSLGGKKEGEYEVVHHVQGEHYHIKIFRVWVIVSGPVGNPAPESSHPS